MSRPTEVDLRRLYDRAPVGFYRSTIDGRFLHANPALVRMLGYDRLDEVLALRVPDELASGLGVPGGVRVTLPTRDGAPRAVHVHGDVVDGEDGRTYEGTVVDVTAEQALEARIAAAQKAESLGALAGGVAHDFNNLLVAMLGNADLALLDLPPGAEARAAVDAIRTAALRAAELTDQLLAVAGRRMTAATRVAVHELLDELLVLLRPTFGPELSVDVAVAADATAVKADPTQLRQVLLTLIANARDARNAIDGRGRLAVRTRAVHADGRPHDDDVLGPPPGDHVVIEIADDGPALDPALRRRIFEPFFVARPRGHGLGLAAVLGIVRGHGGGVRVAAGPGATAFQIFWPAVPGARSHGARVLVVDDEPLVRDVVCRMLQDAGYAALPAADGPAALALLAARPVDAVVLDLSMPGMNGHEVLAAIRTDRPALPVIVVSGGDREGREATGASGFLSKPFHFDELVAVLDAVLDPSRGQ